MLPIRITLRAFKTLLAKSHFISLKPKCPDGRARLRHTYELKGGSIISVNIFSSKNNTILILAKKALVRS